MSGFAANLRKIRKNSKVSQKMLSEHLGYRYTAIANYESGRNEPSIDDLIKIADYFNVSVDYLVGRKIDENTNFLLNCKEIELLEKYRLLNCDLKEAMRFILDWLAREKSLKEYKNRAS